MLMERACPVVQVSKQSYRSGLLLSRHLHQPLEKKVSVTVLRAPHLSAQGQQQKLCRKHLCLCEQTSSDAPANLGKNRQATTVFTPPSLQSQAVPAAGHEGMARPSAPVTPVLSQGWTHTKAYTCKVIPNKSEIT